MWAQRLVAPFRFAEVETATPTVSDLADGQVLLRTLAGGLCGSDLPYFRGQLPLPWGQTLTRSLAELPGFPMHEVVGEVVASKSATIDVGWKVVGWASSDNALAEYVVTDAAGVAPYDSRLAPSTAVILQPLACVLEAAERIPSFAGRDVVVLGLGPIGLLFGHVAKAMGARSVHGVDRVARGDLGPDFGFDETIHAASDNWVTNLPEVERPDIVIEAIGHQQSTLGHAVEALGREGLLYYFGIPDEVSYSVPLQTLLRKNLTLMTGITVRKQAALSLANDYLARFPALAGRYITDRFKVSDVSEAYALAAAPSEGRAKIVLEMA
jgi:threonine dehydrogenase-like Zn-dependent dehydrogenase